ncbi:MAG TPA: hypothetical protein V6C85_31420 [Allocoleopsis sp.]
MYNRMTGFSLPFSSGERSEGFVLSGLLLSCCPTEFVDEDDNRGSGR